MTPDVEVIVKRIQQEHHSLFSFNRSCLGKSLKFRRECRRIGINSKVVFGLCTAKIERFNLTVLTLHAWGEVDNERIEVTLPRGRLGGVGILYENIKPIITFWI